MKASLLRFSRKPSTWSVGLVLVALSLVGATQQSLEGDAWLGLLALAPAALLLALALKLPEPAPIPAPEPQEIETVPALAGLAELPVIAIYPFASTDDAPEKFLLALSFSRMLSRNLFLVPDLSVRVPGDTLVAPRELLRDSSAIRSFQHWAVSGTLRVGSCLSADIELISATEIRRVTVSANSIPRFLSMCCGAICRLLELPVPKLLRPRWHRALPASLKVMRLHGHIILLSLSRNSQAAADELIGRLAELQPSFVLPYQSLSSAAEERLEKLFSALQRDPDDVELTWLCFLALRSRGSPEALSMLQRTLELCRGHGRAHAALSQISKTSPSTLSHSQIGYRLLPGDRAAILNYVNALEGNGGRPEQLIALGKEIVRLAPEDPMSYDRLVNWLVELRRYDEALRYALLLQKLVGPPLAPTTRGWLDRHPTGEAVQRRIFGLQIALQQLIPFLEKNRSQEGGSSA